MADPAEKPKSYRSPLWPPPGDPAAAHKVIPGTRECAPDCSCWSTRRGRPAPTRMLLVHAPAEADLTRALCGGLDGEVTGVTFHSVVTCPGCRERQGEVRDFLGRGAHVVLVSPRAAPLPGQDREPAPSPHEKDGR
jgi:hypothetical protein